MRLPDVGALFTPNNGVCFIAGMAAMRIWCWVQDRYRDVVDPDGAPHRGRLKPFVLVWGCAAVATIFLGVQGQSNHNAAIAQAAQAKAFAAQVADCQKKTTVALNARDALRQQLLKAADDWDDAIESYVDIEANPPEDIASIHTTDPVYQAWSQGVTRQFQQQLQSIRQQRQRINDELANHPLASTSCD